MHYYYGSTRGRGHTWLLTADEQRRDFKKPFTTNCHLELSDAGIHFLVFKQVFGLGGRGYSSQRSAHRQCLHSVGTVPHQSYSQFWKAEGQLFLHLHFWA